MAYKIIDSGLKLRVIKDFWSTGNVTKTADKYGISRNAVYDWTALAEQTVREAFKMSIPGRRTISLEEENKHLRSQIQELLDAYHRLSQDRTSEPIIEPMIAECPDCHSSEVCKNGKVYTKTDGLRQRFLCRRCSLSIYVEIKKKS